MNNDAFLELRGIGKHFRTGAARQHVVKAVDGVSFSVGKGETLGLVGESGCGKTTLGRCLLQLIQPTTGELFFRGEPILGVSGAAMKRLRRDMQIIFQDPYSSLNPRMTVGRIIASGLAIQGMGTPQERLDAARKLMDRVGLPTDHTTVFPTNSAAGRPSAASASPAPCPSIRSSSWPMNPFPRWTYPSRPRSSTFSSGSSKSTA